MLLSDLTDIQSEQVAAVFIAGRNIYGRQVYRRELLTGVPKVVTVAVAFPKESRGT
jgi:hypothetical protein